MSMRIGEPLAVYTTPPQSRSEKELWAKWVITGHENQKGIEASTRPFPLT